jgi:pilus assembly protein CpaE
MLASALATRKTAAAAALAAFVRDAASLEAIKQAANGIDIKDGRFTQCDLSEAVRRLAKMKTPRVLIVDIDEEPDVLTALASLSEVCDEETQVLATGGSNDIGLYKDLLGLGLSDYLVKPLNPDLLGQAIKKILCPEPEKAGGRAYGRLVTIIGARGGVGATSIAVNLASILAGEDKQKTALVDLDLFFGTCGLALDLEIGRGFREALENPSRIDGLFIERAMVKEGENLFVLSGEEALDYMITFDASAFELLIDHLRRDFPYVIVDLPRFAARSQLSMLTQPASAIVVSDASLAGMRDSRRLVALLKQGVPDCNLHLVLNKTGAASGAELPIKEFEKVCGLKIDAVIPYEPKVFALNANSGKALPKVARNARTTKAIHELTRKVAGSAKKASKTASVPLWSRFLKGK